MNGSRQREAPVVGRKSLLRSVALIFAVLIIVAVVGSLPVRQTAPMSDASLPAESHIPETTVQSNAEEPSTEPALQVRGEKHSPSFQRRQDSRPFVTTQTPLPLPYARLESSDTSPSVSSYRPPNGTYIQPPLLTDGRSTLHIENGTAYDAVVKLVLRRGETSVTARFIYIQSGEQVLLKNIEQGVYSLAWCSGSDWNPSTERFEQPLGCFTFEKSLIFTEGVTREGEHLRRQHTVMWVTLHSVPSGNVTRQAISEETFHSL